MCSVVWIATFARGLQAPRPTAPTPDILIKAIRHWSNGDITKIAVDLTAKPSKFKTGYLTNPDRIFLDIFDVQPTPAVLIKTVAQDDGFLHNVRVARSEENVVRIAIDLAHPAEYTATLVPDPYRLELELRAPGSTSRKPKEPVEKALVTSTIESVTVLPDHEANRGSGGQDGAEAVKANDPRARETARTLIRTLGLKIGRVVIDPGHGGDDYGTISPNGLREKDIVLDIAIRLGRQLQSLGAEVVYTRTGDYFLPLETRTLMANREQADLFVSIHANSSPDRSIRGMETYFLNFTSSPDALQVAQRENTVNQKSVGELRGVLQKIAQQEKLYESREFATTVQQSLARALPDERNRGVKEAPFIVLTGATMPAILTEISFLTNADEEHNLSDPAYRQRVAEALYTGVSEYIASLGGVRQPRPQRAAGAMGASAVLPASNHALDKVLDFIALHRTFLVMGCVLAAVWSFLLIAPPSSRRKKGATSSSKKPSAPTAAEPRLRIVRRSNGQPLP